MDEIGLFQQPNFDNFTQYGVTARPSSHAGFLIGDKKVLRHILYNKGGVKKKLNSSQIEDFNGVEFGVDLTGFGFELVLETSRRNTF